MSLLLLGPLVVAGIALVVAAVHFTGGSKVATIRDPAHALSLFLTDFPNEKPGAPELTSEGHSAFMSLTGDRTGIVQSFGDGFFTRVIAASDIAQIRLSRPGVVTIRFRDFTWTGGNFHFDQPATAQAIAASLGLPRKET